MNKCKECKWFKNKVRFIGWCRKEIDISKVDINFISINKTFDPRDGYVRTIGSSYKLFNLYGTCLFFSHKNIFVRLYQRMKKNETP